MQVEIRNISLAEFAQAPNIGELVAEYAQESSISGFGVADPQWPIYETMEKVGLAQGVGAFLDDELVGGLILLTSVVPHYGRLASSTESLFVAGKARCTGAGLQLIRAAEQLAKQRGAVGIFISSPSEGRLARVLPRHGYSQTNVTFFKGLADV